MKMIDIRRNPVIYKRDEFLLLYISDFKLSVKVRARPYQTNKGKRQVYSPSAKNQSQFNFAMMTAIESAPNVDFKPFSGNVGLFASIRAKGGIRGDTDNYLKQIKDALQLTKYPLVHDDKQIVFDCAEKIANYGEDCVLLYIRGAGGLRKDTGAPFVFLRSMLTGGISELFVD